MARKQTSAILLLAYYCTISAVTFSWSPCELLPVKTGHPVEASWRSSRTLSGCSSWGTLGLPQEVHIIRLRHSSPLGARDPPQVVLHLRPFPSLPIHRKPLIVVLSSLHPVVWKLRTENLALDVKRTFHVSLGSEILFEEENVSVLNNILTENFPCGNRRLLTWAKKKYKAVTSFSEFKVTKNIYIKIGEDPAFSKVCKIKRNFVSLNGMVDDMQVQPPRGCVLSHLSHDQEVHIIKLQASDSSRTGLQEDVIVDIKPLNKDENIHRNLVLILKCENPVNWVIQCQGIVGKLNILTFNSVTLDSHAQKLMQVSVITEDYVPSGFQALLHWAEEHNYIPVTSFTTTAVANHLTLWLRQLDAVGDPLKSMFTPNMAALCDSRSHPKSDESAPQGSVSLDQGLPYQSLSSVVKEMPWLGMEQESVLKLGLSVACEEQRIVVCIEKKSLQENGYSRARLTLQDPACTATSNSTHYILETLLTGCQTTRYHLFPSPVEIYFNRVQVSQFELEGGSGWLGYEETEPRKTRFVNTSKKTAVLKSVEPTSSILFNCSYRKRQKPVDPFLSDPRVKDPVSNMTFSMDLYNTNLFHYSLPHTFLTTSENKPIFVEVSATKTDYELGFMIRTCFISPNSNPNIVSDYKLIENICPVDDSVKYYPQRLDFPVPHAQMEKKRFSFNFRSQFNVSLLFLHCEMSLCTKRQKDRLELPMCIQPDDACVSVNVGIIMAMMRNIKTSTKPLVVLSGSQPAAPLGVSGPSTRTFPQAPVHSNVIYVLDTPTVVGISFAAFFIGTILTGALWFIYSHTGGEVTGT